MIVRKRAGDDPQLLVMRVDCMLKGGVKTSRKERLQRDEPGK